MQRKRIEDARVQAEKLAEERRLARAKALEWTQEVKNESDEEKERKAKKATNRKPKTETNGSGDEGVEPVKKKRRGKLRKNVDTEDDGALFSGDEDGEKDRDKPSRKVSVAVSWLSLLLLQSGFGGTGMLIMSMLRSGRRNELCEMKTKKVKLLRRGKNRCALWSPIRR